MRSLVVSGWVLAGLVMVTGCATMRHQEAVYAEAREHMYSRPIEELWPEVVKFVSEEGFPPRKGNQQFVVITDWRSELQDSRVASSSSRLYVEGRRIDRDTSAVRIYKQTLFTGDKGGVSARENRVIGSMVVGAAGDVSPFDYDPIRLSHLMDSTPDHSPLTRQAPQVSRSFSRDGALEWKLLQRLDVEAARSIEARVTARERQ